MGFSAEAAIDGRAWLAAGAPAGEVWLKVDVFDACGTHDRHDWPTPSRHLFASDKRPTKFDSGRRATIMAKHGTWLGWTTRTMADETHHVVCANDEYNGKSYRGLFRRIGSRDPGLR